jgi:hypothetical protein
MASAFSSFVSRVQFAAFSLQLSCLGLGNKTVTVLLPVMEVKNGYNTRVEQDRVGGVFELLKCGCENCANVVGGQPDRKNGINLIPSRYHWDQLDAKVIVLDINFPVRRSICVSLSGPIDMFAYYTIYYIIFASHTQKEEYMIKSTTTIVLLPLCKGQKKQTDLRVVVSRS